MGWAKKKFEMTRNSFAVQMWAWLFSRFQEQDYFKAFQHDQLFWRGCSSISFPKVTLNLFLRSMLTMVLKLKGV